TVQWGIVSSHGKWVCWQGSNRRSPSREPGASPKARYSSVAWGLRTWDIRRKWPRTGRLSTDCGSLFLEPEHQPGGKARVVPGGGRDRWRVDIVGPHAPREEGQDACIHAAAQRIRERIAG